MLVTATKNSVGIGTIFPNSVIKVTISTATLNQSVQLLYHFFSIILDKLKIIC